ncbi:MAG: thermonuclease family protein [Candidatus Electryonea clarkiae]|nr:thermonuclease family protein [Candidatus Electryonea clarkiae]MDP8287105.1 thermonuclease family protein [Candidatus Electryonea clarkiae]
MNKHLLNILLVIVTIVLVWGISYLGAHDQVTEVIEISSLNLKKGRTVNLIGVASQSAEKANEEYINSAKNQIEGNKITLEFTNSFEPDTASVDIAAYIRLNDGTDYNAWLITNGFAAVNDEHQHPRKAEYLVLQEKANSNGLGIWKIVEPVTPDSVDVTMGIES